MNITDYFPDYIEIGYTKKSYGVSGQLRIFIEEKYTSSFSDAEHCFFLMKGCLVPYFIENQEDELVKFESCKNPEDAKNLVSKGIFLHKDQAKDLTDIETNPNSFNFTVGFSLIDSDSEQVIGTITEVLVYPQQEIAMVGNHMIPLNIHNIKGINQEEKLIFVEIPDGLLDL